MKKTIVTAFIALACSLGAIGQNYKFAHIDSQKLLEVMPQRDSAAKVLEKEYKDMENILQEMQVEFNKKYQTYLNKQDSLSSLAKKSKEDELQQLQERVQNYQQTAQQDLQKRESELMKPIMDKAKKAIDDVAKENGFIYVFDSSSGVLLYFSDKSTDLMPLVKKKLGIVEKTEKAAGK